MVKKINITKSALVAILLASPVLASAESDYPASDFKPKVVYSDSDYKHSDSASGSSSSSKTAYDPDFPAAAFEPKVLYKDSEYKHKTDVVSNKTTRPSAESIIVKEKAESSAEKDSDQTMLIGLVVLAAIGFFFYRSKSVPQTTSTPKRSRSSAVTSSVSVNEEGSTRVEKYLAKKQPKATGVAKYLASKEQSVPSTGVAKYMAKQVIRARKAAAENVTGVEKYLRKKG